ncbi:MAG: SPOR domain-containing protein, partial [Magnetococcales bacterium]|nr:SPOR domain-containing protein [Magnetococcales bacterium]
AEAKPAAPPEGPASHAQASEEAPYAVQIAAYLSAKGAQQVVSRFRALGYDPYMVEIHDRKDRLWHSIRVGRYRDPEDARAASQSINKREKVESYVVVGDSFDTLKDPPAPHDAAAAKAPRPPRGDDLQRLPDERLAPPERPAAEALAPTPPPPPVKIATQAVGKGSAPAGGGVKSSSVRRDPVDRSLQRMKEATLSLDVGDLPRAEEALREVVILKPNDWQARRLLAHVMLETGRESAAVTVLEGAFDGAVDANRMALEDSKAAAMLAGLYQRSKEHWKAVDLYEALVRRNTEQGVWWMGLGMSLEAVGQRMEALQAYQKAMESHQISSELRGFIKKRIQGLSG